jgi:hypothetical protein
LIDQYIKRVDGNKTFGLSLSKESLIYQLNLHLVGRGMTLFYISNTMPRIDILISDIHLRLANGIFAEHSLPAKLEGSSQKPDFLWPIYHDSIGANWTLGATEGVRLWCDCIGEGKPVAVPEDGNDHALNQVVISSTASIYHQISLDREHPRVLSFTLNKAIV